MCKMSVKCVSHEQKRRKSYNHFSAWKKAKRFIITGGVFGVVLGLSVSKQSNMSIAIDYYNFHSFFYATSFFLRKFKLLSFDFYKIYS